MQASRGPIDRGRNVAGFQPFGGRGFGTVGCYDRSPHGLKRARAGVAATVIRRARVLDVAALTTRIDAACHCA
ncbi:hypothetical protein SALB1_3009 [Salinisphaera sp. LB1]|nr:hypothetical protein SALB1_3009 [Salinisphaera sp. LB1]